MPGRKLPSVRPKEVVRVLERAGFEFLRSRGSHRCYGKDGIDETVVVPMHRKDIKPGTLRNILRNAHLTRQEFLDLL